MALSDQQVETFIYSFRQQLQQLATEQLTQNGILNQLQIALNAQQATPSTVVVNSGGIGDTYFNNGGILHKLVTTFQAAVTFAATILVNGVATFTAAPVFNSVTASQVLLSTSGKVLTSGLVSLTSLVTGILPVANGGTNASSAAAARSSLSAAALPQTINGSSFQYPGQSSSSCAGSQSITVTGSSFTAPIGGGPCTGTFSFTINGTNFTFSVNPANNTGSQSLV